MKIEETSLRNQLDILIHCDKTIMNKYLLPNWKEVYRHSLHHSGCSKKFIKEMEEKLYFATENRSITIFEMLDKIEEED